ncbi:MAG TPA: CFI-box-CTERM domain-containing protein, partial [Nitrososphaeraceae archaeon]|nr:CFI-box-CTERM domain-containing protein [Nitrososphaeraceae archaeon]
MTGGAPAYVPDQGSSDGSSSGSSSSGSSSSGSGEGGGCLIATAAFGTELSPQVQFLRDFRDRDILSTFAGSSFMVAFNTWYYSFSPYVADYERQQPWFRDIVTVSLYPLLAVLYVSEKTYSFLEGETGAVVTGIITGLLLG